VGPKPSSSSASTDGLLLVDLATICTFFSCSSAVSWAPFQNEGTCVAKRFVCVLLLAG
jgi:hypothetical protein